MGKFDAYFKVRRNTIFERARFNRRSQREGESAEQYITELYELIEICEYGELKEEMLRDRLVVGIQDLTLSEKLQTDPELTLEKAKTMIRQKAAAKEHRRELLGDNGAALNRLRRGNGPRTSKWKQGGTSGTSPFDNRSHYNEGGANRSWSNEKHCTRCGRNKHQPGDRCPALGVTCHKCKKKGHFKAQCFSKTVATVSAAPKENRDQPGFLGVVTSSEEASWSVDIRLKRQIVTFKMDTGAEVTAINEGTHQLLGEPELRKPTKVLWGPAHQTLDVVGQFMGWLKYRKRSARQSVYVVKGLKTNLLGLRAITALQLACRIDAVNTEEPDIVKRFPQVFEGLETIGEEYRIKLRDNATPYSLYVPRNVPIPLRPKVEQELNRMERLGVISKVTTPAAWCAGMVVVPKKTGEVRICVDLKPLNESVQREPYPMPKVDDTLALLSGATIFSKLDANSGFWQIPLSKESRPLTTFITPFGRFHFNKLPFGISCAPELFQRRMNQMLEGLEGVVCLVDDVLVFGSNREEHDTRLVAVLQRLGKAGATLNREKCVFYKTSVKFLGHVLDQDGIHADPEKTSAISNMEQPQSVTDLRRFMGLVNQLGKFSPRIAEISQPLRGLLSNKSAWVWGPDQERSFVEIKCELTKSTVLALYDPLAETNMSADASSFGLGAVLLQLDRQTWKPVAYASRALSETERRYAQIEKEGLATTWACEKFSTYILGRPFVVESDHKPLVPLLNTKQLDNLPPRILRFCLRLAKYNYIAQHVPGKLLYAADALSHAPIPGESEDELQEEVEAYVDHITMSTIPATNHRLQEYRQAQKEDAECLKVRDYCQTHWPDKHSIESSLKPYWKVRGSLTLCDDLLLYNSRIVVPPSLRRETMLKIHEGHQGVERCRERVRSSVWWPGVTSQVKQFVENCRECAKVARPRREPLLLTPLPDYPWQVVGSDLFELKGEHYLLTVDYFSRYPEVIKLSSTTSSNIIALLKTIFARHGIPEVLRTDNGPQYVAKEFAVFAKAYGFQHITSSPRFPQSNGQVERMVQTIKGILKNSTDPHLAVLSYRATPMPWCGLSPSELLMGRRIRTTVPQTKKQLTPSWSYLPQFKRDNLHFKEKQKENFDKHHHAREQSEIPDGSEVVITTDKQPVEGRVIKPAETPGLISYKPPLVR